MSLHNLELLLPYGLTGMGALIVLLLGVLPGNKNNKIPYIGSVVILLLTIFQVGTLFHYNARIENFVAINPLTLATFELCAAGGLATILMAQYYPKLNQHVDEAFYGLIIIAVLGTFLLVSAINLLAAFIGMELIAIPMFALIAWNPKRKGAIEGAIKYAVTATVAAAFFIFGIVLIYFGTGTLIMNEIPLALMGPDAIPSLVNIGIVLLLIGVAFELALAPFHCWLADAFQSAPAPIMAFIGSIAKIAVLIFVIHFAMSIAPIWGDFNSVLWVLVLLSILLGNLLALRQTNIKRMLAYSSVAQFGYILMALACVSDGTSISMVEGLRAAAYYGFSYAIMNMVVFAVIAMMSKYNPTGELAGYRGLGRRYPLAGGAMVIAVLSLAGIPPTAGFFAKLFLFTAVLNSGHIGFVILAALGSAISVFYYLRILLAFFAKEPQPSVSVSTTGRYSVTESIDFGSTLVMTICAVGTIAFGLFAQTALNMMF
ncbi:NADH-quinone oxidoreductase subunit N [Photobacterium phosphoreum]|uniref:NADH-quinone oxidoreductase subunit N n=1 Tax=Photobacterium phosphoreum TaxID=659 RepID=UPI001E3A6F43|nr:NADH-quinone oxidoreductase subunit N [Photobacterium phosphoreum]MCD9503431.1 NADH-quinone oxidoreductase subunit N [Photobacterium phosphoreum]